MTYNPNSTSNIDQLSTCMYKLPCGYCRLLGAMCPNSLYNTSPVYRTDVTNKVELNNITTTTNTSEITNK